MHKLIDFNRTTVTIDIEPCIIGVGDSPEKKQAEKLAALSAVYQLHGRGLVRFPTIFQPRTSQHILSSTTLNGCILTQVIQPKSLSQMALWSVTRKHEALWITIVVATVSESLTLHSRNSAKAALGGKLS
jgi:hypothetical protein